MKWNDYSSIRTLVSITLISFLRPLTRYIKIFINIVEYWKIFQYSKWRFDFFTFFLKLLFISRRSIDSNKEIGIITPVIFTDSSKIY